MYFLEFHRNRVWSDLPSAECCELLPGAVRVPFSPGEVFCRTCAARSGSARRDAPSACFQFGALGVKLLWTRVFISLGCMPWSGGAGPGRVCVTVGAASHPQRVSPHACLAGVAGGHRCSPCRCGYCGPQRLGPFQWLGVVFFLFCFVLIKSTREGERACRTGGQREEEKQGA